MCLVVQIFVKSVKWTVNEHLGLADLCQGGCLTVQQQQHIQRGESEFLREQKENESALFCFLQIKTTNNLL